MKLPTKILLLTLLMPFLATAATEPNIVIIYADDMGYGDVQCLNPKRGKIATPHMDDLASEGMIFTDAHTTSSVCTPSRYGLLTGRYNWRTHLQRGVTWGYSPPLIDSGRLTVAGMLKNNGYDTAIIGKWHLGMTLPTTNGILPVGRTPESLNILWDGQIKDGPTDVGFDYFYGISASLDMPPYFYIENDHFDGEINNNGKANKAIGFKTIDVLPEIGKRAAAYISEHKGEKPFFIYVPLTSPHTPIVPSKQWQGKSKLGPYGDFQMQTDAVIGQVIDAVDQAGLTENTLVIVSSDNGCSKAANIKGLEEQGHYPSAHFRGSKADLYDGGHRVPFIVRWPAGIKAGSRSDETICLTDIMATCADVAGIKLPDGAGEDSVSFLPTFSGNPIKSTRAGIIHHSISGHFAYRQGKWKLLLARGSGGWSAPSEAKSARNPSEGQLYNMEKDPGEKNNLYETNPEVAASLLAQLKSDISRGRSTAGPTLKNDIKDIILWKNLKTR